MSTPTKGAGVVNRHSRTRGSGERHRRRSPAGIALLFLLPALIALLLLRLAPAGVALVDSLSRTTLLGGTSFVGLGNYVELFANADFQNSLAVTLLFAVIINPVQIAAAFLLAVLFTRRAVGSKFWRSMVILPIAVPPAVSAVVWSVIYRPDGLANGFLAVFGIPPQPFLTSPYQALLSIMILLSWIGVGYWMMFLIAGLNDIPTSYYEAASLDGASWWRQTWSITLPLLRRPLAFVLVADTVSNFLVFAPVQILTKGGPNGSTNLLMHDLYTRAFTFGDINKAQAEVVILVLITVVIVALQFRLLKTEDQP
ncbi:MULTISPECIES: carbohydrate ABC transporter permease [unclassified Microbacterium]|uniref:carbohydrate ABC transporter permease n=1 Tax=unclassified Microbacterium TaxID=2609290 RepID=UPI000CFC56AD|nr:MULTISPECIES: sugar ABC transporter permease [unclassified Microbacterium]PQZ55978.1 ABC transporter permease [Microbacterium sp. MYb43]PQZ78570.1 ABC transporter permease [Microbacterium sp. MYb40]PRB22678.1 ABC transporter permease [Microbacterium sp. MYb54]PRB26751.1 ABC transporter permease [Microbacterium sp. MYb50]PRB68944.1 ABC transporter permease [Microbacterium sp. MYb24]